MHSFRIFSTLLAVGAGVVSGATATTCTTDITITQPTPTIDCDVVDGDINVDQSVAGDLSIEGPRQITGDLNVTNATQLISISSSSIQSIGGTLNLQGLTLLSSLKMDSLSSLNKMDLNNLPQLSALTFGDSGVTQASSVMVADTFLNDVSGLNIESVDTLQITNNNRLTKFNSNLVNITNLLSITSNGNNMQINMTKLQVAAEIQLSNIQSFDVPKLSKVTQSLKFDTNPSLLSFSAPNLTSIADSATFINNNELTNISFPLLTSVGDLTIQNNTALDAVQGFPALQTVAGGVILRGNFSAVQLPDLDVVKGGVTVMSTTDISEFCHFFDNAKSKGIIQGQESCKSNVAQANEGGSDGSSNAAVNSTDSGIALGVNGVLLGMSVLAGMAQLW